MNLIVAYLFIMGRLEFFVLIDVSHPFCGERYRLHAHSKLVPAVTGLLIGGGTISLLLLEWNNPKTLGDLPVIDKI